MSCSNASAKLAATRRTCAAEVKAAQQERDAAIHQAEGKVAKAEMAMVDLRTQLKQITALNETEKWKSRVGGLQERIRCLEEESSVKVGREFEIKAKYAHFNPILPYFNPI